LRDVSKLVENNTTTRVTTHSLNGQQIVPSFTTTMSSQEACLGSRQLQTSCNQRNYRSSTMKKGLSTKVKVIYM
jgi:hypothetical protein